MRQERKLNSFRIDPAGGGGDKETLRLAWYKETGRGRGLAGGGGRLGDILNLQRDKERKRGMGALESHRLRN